MNGDGGRTRRRTLAWWIASVAFVGRAPIAPGTFGSAAGLVVHLIARRTGGAIGEVVLIPMLFALGIWAATRVSEAVGRSDPGVVVIDEVVGMLVTLALLPVSYTGLLVGFLLFRLFDIVKPFPAAQSERLPGGIGIMTDDVIAGVYAHLVLRGLAWAWPAGLLL